MTRNLSNRKNARTGFTLVELLLVIAIMAVMSSMALVVMRNAQDEAKRAATISRLQQLDSILQIQIEDYEVRRLPIGLRELQLYVAANRVHTDPSRDVIQLRNLKRRIIADLINAEVPRPVFSAAGVFELNTDLGNFPTDSIPFGGAESFRTWLDNNYGNPVNGIALSDRLSRVTPASVLTWTRFSTDTNFNLPGEYVYQVLRKIEIDGTPAIEQMNQSSFRDADLDGYLEVVDAWGDQMLLSIWQVEAVEVDDAGAISVGSDRWVDADEAAGGPPRNFEVFTPVIISGYPDEVPLRDPVGFELLNPIKPREISDIRFDTHSIGLASRYGGSRN